MSRNQASLCFSPTFGYDLCSRRAEGKIDHGFDLTSWRAAGVGGDMIRPHVLERFGEVFASYGFRSSAFLPSYGMAEATLAVSFSPLDQGVTVDVVDRHRLTEDHLASPATNGSAENRRSFVVCGTPLPDHTVEIRDPYGEPLPERRIGEIFVKGPNIASGYLNDPEATAEVFHDGWLKTGDLGYFVDGALAITGRSKDLIIINGRNIWPQDLEWAVEQLPGLRPSDVAAFSINETTDDAAVVLLIQCRPRDPEARAQLVHAAKAKVLEASSLECKVVLVAPHSLPVTSSGKLSRARAKRNYRAGLYDGGENADAVAAHRPSPMLAETSAREGDA
jgi:fatty-acyl-CoA synthase